MRAGHETDRQHKKKRNIEREDGGRDGNRDKTVTEINREKRAM